MSTDPLPRPILLTLLSAVILTPGCTRVVETEVRTWATYGTLWKESDLIVLGRIRSTDARWVEVRDGQKNGQALMETVNLYVESVYVGSAGPELTFGDIVDFGRFPTPGYSGPPPVRPGPRRVAGTRGVFFLRRESGGTLRATSDGNVAMRPVHCVKPASFAHALLNWRCHDRGPEPFLTRREFFQLALLARSHSGIGAVYEAIRDGYESSPAEYRLTAGEDVLSQWGLCMRSTERASDELTDARLHTYPGIIRTPWKIPPPKERAGWFGTPADWAAEVAKEPSGPSLDNFLACHPSPDLQALATRSVTPKCIPCEHE